MELRYVRNGKNYFPEYKNNKGEWNSFYRKHIGKEGTTLHRLCEKLTTLDTGYINGKFFNDEEKLVMRSELTACAFLGAAKVWFNIDEREFKL